MTAPTPAALAALLERLLTISTARTWDSVGRPYDYPAHLPKEAADAISALRAQIETLTAERDEALPWMWFYGIGLDLGEIAKRTGKSIYAYSPWLTAPITRTVLECSEASRAKVEAAEVRALAADAAHTREYEARIATEMEQSAAVSARAEALVSARIDGAFNALFAEHTEKGLQAASAPHLRGWFVGRIHRALGAHVPGVAEAVDKFMDELQSVRPHAVPEQKS